MKKLTALVIILTLLLSLMPMTLASQSNVITEQHIRSAETLYHLGLLTDLPDEQALDTVITRGEFTALLLKILGQEASYAAGGAFSDVPDNHTYKNAINHAAALGLVNGKAPGVFAPDAPIVYEETVALLIKALGFERLASYTAAYPAGYLTVAQQKGVLDHVTAVKSQILRRNAVYQMIFNALETEVFKEDTISASGVSGTVSKGVTLLSEGMKLMRYTGVVEASDVSSLTGTDGVNRGLVRIDGVTYQAGETGAAALLGYLVDYYVDISDASLEVKPLRHVAASSLNEVLTVDSRDLLAGDSSFSKQMLVYQTDKRRTATISPYADFLYNGVWKVCTAADMVPASGAVSLIDHDGDGTADVVAITSYTTIVVDSVAAESYIAFDKYTGVSVVLDPNLDDRKAVLLKNGAADSFSSIKEWSILTVAESQNTADVKLVTALHSRDYVDGVLQERHEDYVRIEGIEYRIAPDAKSRVAQADAGVSGRWYLDALGHVAAYDHAADYRTTMDYAYLIDVDVEQGMAAECFLKLLKTDGTVAVHQAAEKISLDGAPAAKISSAELSAKLKTAAGGSDFKQVVRCGMNAEDKVNRLDTLTPGTGGDGDSLSRDYVADPTAANLPRYSQYAYGLGIETLQVLVGADTKIFSIPAAGSVQEDSDYRVSSIGELAHLGEYDISCYDLSDTKVAGLIVTSMSEATLSKQPTPALVLGLGQGVSSSGEVKTNIKLWYEGAERVYLLADDGILQDTAQVPDKKLEAGDVIVFSINNDGEIGEMKKFFNSKTAPFGYTDYTYGQIYTNDWWFYANLRVTLGRLIAKEGDSILVAYGDDPADTTKQEPRMLRMTCRAAVYDTSTGKMYAISLGELAGYTYDRNPNVRLFVATASGMPYDIFVIHPGT